MSRWIDVDKFERCLRNCRPYVDSGRFNAIQTEVNQVLDCIEYEIEDAPSIEIVRCGECKYREDCEKTLVLESVYGEIEDYANLDFCSYGERSEKPNNSTISKMEQVGKE